MKLATFLTHFTCLILAVLLSSSHAQTVSYSVISCTANKTDAFCKASAGTAPNSCCATIVESVKNLTTLVVTNTTSYSCLPNDFVFYQNLSPFVTSTTSTYHYDCVDTNLTNSGRCSSALTKCGNSRCCMDRSGTINSVSTEFDGIC